jgi:hypothetical protein
MSNQPSQPPRPLRSGMTLEDRATCHLTHGRRRGRVMQGGCEAEGEPCAMSLSVPWRWVGETPS